MEPANNRFPILWTILIIGLVLIIAAVAVYFLFFNNNPETTDSNSHPTFVESPDTSTGVVAVVEDGVGGGGSEDGDQPFVIHLSDGTAQDQEQEPIPLAVTSPLSPEEIDAILARLPALQVAPGDQVEFKLPGDPIPPPRPGQTIDQTFPVDTEAQPPVVPSGPLEVLRFAPEGEVPIAPTINITFNQPMVPLGTLAQLSEEDVPVKITPDIPGTWSWVGTRTLRFNFNSDEIDRLPMATQYKVTIPAGTQSVTGGTLAEDISWSFRTPPPTMEQYYPNYGPQDLEPFMFISFDQRIDPQAVLDTITATADGKPFSVSLADEEAYTEDDDINRLIENASESRWMVFTADDPLPKDSEITITIGPETPSAEGPITTASAQNFSFYTYPPLRIEDHTCSWYSSNELCYPLSPFYIRFNNPLDPDVYQDSMISIDPVIPGATISIADNSITISGATQGSTTYRVTIDAGLTDTFGQQLGRDEKLTFKVGKAEPVLFKPDDILVTLDPASKSPTLSLYTINYDSLDVKVYSVVPSDWPAFQTYLQEFNRTDQPPLPPGQLVMDKRVEIDAKDDQLTEVGIDLSEVMDGDYGHFIVYVSPPKGFFEEDRYWEKLNLWVQVTQIGLDAFSDFNQMVVWATDLQNGAPLDEISIHSDTGSIQTTTTAEGIARFEIPQNGIHYLTAQRGEDIAFLPRSTYYWGDDRWQRVSEEDNLAWYVFDDRSMYRPEEEVHVKGWMRRITSGPQGDVELVGETVQQVSYQVTGPQGNEITSGMVPVNAYGGFDLTFTLPENVNLGYAQIYLRAIGSIGNITNNQFYHSFQIQEFRRPEFEVTARNETTGPYFVNDSAVVAVQAEYYAGGPLPNAEVNWFVTSSPTNYQPPNWPDFTFGTWIPWWFYGGYLYEAGFGYGGYDTGSNYTSFTGRTDPTGNHYLTMEFENNGEPRPYSIQAQGSVIDVNRQSWAGSTSLLVHPADNYIGMRTDTYFVERNTPIEVELIVTDLDGHPIPDRPIVVQAARLEWKYQKGRWQEVEVEVQECLVTSQEDIVSCIFETPIGGTYQITAVVTDEQGRENQSQFNRWVSGGQMPPSREVEKEAVTLIPDKETYQPGDVAEILVQSPFSPAEGLLTVTRSGILYTERFIIEEDTTTLLIPIEDTYYPNINLQVDLVGAADRIDDKGNVVEGIPQRPAYASGNLTLNIPPLGRTLSLEIKPRETSLAPGESTVVNLSLKDADGNPVPDAELVLVVVDEAILALSNYQLTDPLSVFYYNRPANLFSVYSRSSIVLVDPMQLLASNEAQVGNVLDALSTQTLADTADMALEEPAMEAPAAAEEGIGGDLNKSAEGAPIQLRSDFNPLAIFAPEVRTDSDGNARVRVTLPDNLTRYRVMAVAVDSGGRRFGSGESSITARLPLMVRPSASRFLNYGDQFEMPVVLQNQTDEDMTVSVVAQVGNLELTGDVGVQVSVPANDRVEVRFPGTTDSAGTAQVQFAAVSGDNADAAIVSLPVYTPATTEAFATYGVVDQGAVLQPLAPPEGVIPIYGGLEITTSSTALQALTDAVLYLVSYPFDCSEQIASRILGIASLRDVLAAFEAEGLPSPEAMEKSVLQDIEELQRLQNYDGGFPYWRRGRESIPFNTVHVAFALQRARMMGFDVPEDMWQNTLNYLRNIENYYPSWYSKEIKQTISAYAIYVRMEMDDPDPTKANALLRDGGVEQLPLEATGWILQVLTRYSGYENQLEAIRRHLNNQAVETAGAANFITGYTDDAYVLLHSNRRTDAILLDALISDDPQSDLIPKLVNGLLAHRTKGRWYNTQENVFVLLALDHYFDTFENVEPDFVARMWLGEDYIGSSTFQGYTTDSYQLDVPMQFLVDSFSGEQNQQIILQKEGDGRLYYRLGLRYAPTDLRLDPMDMGFVIQRVYEGVDDPEDVYQDQDGVWHIKAGSRVRVRITMVADNRRYHVALVDHLAAGLEVINPALAVSETVPSDPNSRGQDYWWWWWTWYEHQNMRDERVEAFSTLLWDGVYEYTYEVRATMPGKFVVPPAKAEEMYSPEVFGRSASDILIVE